MGFAEREIGVDGGVGGVARERWAERRRWATQRETAAMAAMAITKVPRGGGWATLNGRYAAMMAPVALRGRGGRCGGKQQQQRQRQKCRKGEVGFVARLEALGGRGGQGLRGIRK
mmetsp:Transcript_25449/g.51091  ORF Transcript_25449/g.51091 Transcript_25449/m.51091 type:complete len:115 (+) Transcript_25449:23-367(+)